MRDLKGMKGILGFPLKGIFPLKKEADTKEGFPVKRTGTVLSFQLSLQLQGPSPPFHSGMRAIREDKNQIGHGAGGACFFSVFPPDFPCKKP